MSDIKNIDEDENKDSSPQTLERSEVAGNTVSLFSEKRTARDMRQDLFRDRTLKDWLDDNKKRAIQFKRRPAHKKLWQSNLASSTPNAKMVGIVSKLATQSMEAKVNSIDEISSVNFLRERVFNSLLLKASKKNNDGFNLVLEMLEAAEKGIVIGMEDWFHGVNTIREVSDQDSETGEMKFTEKKIKTWNDVRGTLINIEDFYPGNLNVRPGQIQDMDDCFYRRILTKDGFDKEFGKFPDADKVMTVSEATVNESTPFWKQSDDVGNEQVEVLYYFNKHTDEYVILANEIWINFQGKDTVQPMPWNHKQLPFWAAVFEPLDKAFFYGRSFIDKLISYSDYGDATLDRILDQMTLAVSAPYLIDKAAQASVKGYLQPQTLIPTDFTNGQPNIMRVPIDQPSSVSVSLWQQIRQVQNEDSISSDTLGGSSPRSKTAEEVATQREAALELVSLFLKFMEEGVKQKNELRLANMIQFYSMPVHTEEGDKETRFRTFILRDQELGNGQRGTMQIDIKDDINQDEVEELDRQTVGETEFLQVSPDFIRNMKAEIEIVPQSSIKMTESQKQILELNFQRIMAELYPDKVNRDESFNELVRVFNKDADKLKAEEGQQEQGVDLGQSLGEQTGGGIGGDNQPNIPQLEGLGNL